MNYQRVGIFNVYYIFCLFFHKKTRRIAWRCETKKKNNNAEFALLQFFFQPKNSAVTLKAIKNDRYNSTWKRKRFPGLLRTFFRRTTSRFVSGKINFLSVTFPLIFRCRHNRHLQFNKPYAWQLLDKAHRASPNYWKTSPEIFSPKRRSFSLRRRCK